MSQRRQTRQGPLSDGAGTVLGIMPSVHSPIPGGTMIDVLEEVLSLLDA